MSTQAVATEYYESSRLAKYPFEPYWPKQKLRICVTGVSLGACSMLTALLHVPQQVLSLLAALQRKLRVYQFSWLIWAVIIMWLRGCAGGRVHCLPSGQEAKVRRALPGVLRLEEEQPYECEYLPSSTFHPLPVTKLLSENRDMQSEAFHRFMLVTALLS